MAEARTRQPIVTVLGHVDHGKTLLITQQVGASFIPIDVIRKTCGALMSSLKTEITIPGLLFIDTPGHEAFTTLRKRGGSVADLAILVVDITSGFQPQTDESLALLREFKTPFVVAATKVDKVTGWQPHNGACVLDSLKEQREDVKTEFELKVYEVIGQLSERGHSAERFDRIEDFTKQIAVIPCSGMTGEGVPELLMMLAGIAQQYLAGKLVTSERGEGVVLEVKDVRGFGTTIDVILYNGSVRRGDYAVIGSRQPIATKIKALLLPKPMKELRVERQFDSVDEVTAAAGVKVAGPDMDKVIAGSPIIFVRRESEIEAAKTEVQKDMEQVEFSRDIEGIIVKADTLGALEAMIKIVGAEGIPVRKAEVGAVNKQDIIEAQSPKDELKRVVFAFNVRTLPDADEIAKDIKIKIFSSDIIYHTVEDYKKWTHERRERELEEKLAKVMRPVKLRILKDHIFRASKPAIVGIEVLAGVLKKDAQLKREADPDGKAVGKVKTIERDGKHIDSAKKGDRVAINMEEPVVGKTIFEEDVLVSYLSKDDRKVLAEVREKLFADEKDLLAEL
ncbi:MAG: translation initiation factor IF-2 [Candidatus Aenigmarchaeota archaeon]|nr:translation initiation factor IF-2 [Candidatus Aenigmarchaeota archaeon]